MLKITFLTGEYPPMQGGIADHTAYLAQYLMTLKAEPSILTSRRWQETVSTSPPHLLTPSSPHSSIHPVVPNWTWRCWPAITRFLNLHRPDVLHLQYQAAAFDLGGWINWLPWYLKKRRFETRLVTTFHDLRIPYIFPKAGPFRWQSILALARHSDAVICTNREDLHTLQHALPSSPHPPTSSPLSSPISPLLQAEGPLLTLIPLGSNVEPQPPANFERTGWRKKYGAGDGTLLLAYFGFLNESKGGEELIEALALLRQWGLDARLLFIGGEVGHADPTNMTYAGRVRTLIQAHNLDQVVYATGYIDLPEVSANLLAADGVVMPYRDGVSFRRTTLIAALRHGCPVISTMPVDSALIPEIRPGENMLLAPPRHPTALAQTVALLARDTALRQKLADGASQLGAMFEWNSIARQTMTLYRTLVHYHSCE